VSVTTRNNHNGKNNGTYLLGAQVFYLLRIYNLVAVGQALQTRTQRVGHSRLKGRVFASGAVEAIIFIDLVFARQCALEVVLVPSVLHISVSEL